MHHNCQRIVSLLSSATEILYAIGLGDRVVGVSHECDFPLDATTKPKVTYAHVDSSQSSAAIDAQVHAMIDDGKPLYGIDDTILRELAPDLIVTQAQCDVCAVRYEDVLSTVSSLGWSESTRVLALNPTSLQEVFEDILRVGSAAGAQAAAELCVAELHTRVAVVRQALADVPAEEYERTAIIEWVEPLMLAGNWMPDLLTMAGGVCLLTEPGKHSAYVRWDEILELDPQVVLVAACGFNLERNIEEAERLRELPGWHEMTAVRKGGLFAVDGNAYFNRSGPRLVDSLEILAHLLHPRRVSVPDRLASPAWQLLR